MRCDVNLRKLKCAVGQPARLDNLLVGTRGRKYGRVIAWAIEAGREKGSLKSVEREEGRTEENGHYLL